MYSISAKTSGNCIYCRRVTDSWVQISMQKRHCFKWGAMNKKKWLINAVTNDNDKIEERLNAYNLK